MYLYMTIFQFLSFGLEYLIHSHLRQLLVEKTLESPLDCKEIQPVHSEGDQPWDFFGRNDAKAETPVLWPPHWKRLWCWEGLGAGGEGDDRVWDGWMASLTRWTWVWVNSGSWWWTGRPGMLRFMGSQRVGHNWATDLIWSLMLGLQLPLCFLFSMCVSSPFCSSLPSLPLILCWTNI